MAIVYGRVGVFGITAPKPLIGIPEGVAVLSMFPDSYVSVRINVGNSYADYHVELTEDGEYWRPFLQRNAHQEYTHTSGTRSTGHTVQYHYKLTHGGNLRAKD